MVAIASILYIRLHVLLLDTDTEFNDLMSISDANAWICYKCKDTLTKIDMLIKEAQDLKTKMLKELLISTQTSSTHIRARQSDFADCEAAPKRPRLDLSQNSPSCIVSVTASTK